MLNRFLIVGIVAILVFATAGSERASADPAPAAGQSGDITGKVDGRVIEANNAFAFALFEKTCDAGENKNIFVSPLSISIALAMTYNGAAKETADAMADALRFSGIDTADLNQAMKDIGATVAEADSGIQLTIANSLWGRQGFQFSDDFFDVNRRYYNAEVSILDFAKPEALETINGWVDKSTNGLIDKILDEISPDAVLYLINAIYFKGTWLTEFDPKETSAFNFHLAEGGTEPVQMMEQSGSYRYAEDTEVQAVRLPYNGDRFAMYVFLPGAESTVESFLEDLDETTWADWMSKFTKTKGDVYFPRFKIEYECTLNKALASLGMGIAFDSRKANFSKIAPLSETDRNLFISEVKHKVVVDVNEEGTEAAAVTSVEIKATSFSPDKHFTFVAERPFFFAIRDDLTGSIVFMGIIHHPSS